MAQPVLSCRNVWKLFGPKPEEYLASLSASGSSANGSSACLSDSLHTDTSIDASADVSFDDIREAGYIAAVRDVNLDIDPGEILVIMGLSGSGKSTLVRCLSRLVDITGGDITVDGQNLMALSERELIDLRRNKMGMVFQNFALLPHRTVLSNVSYPLQMRGQDRHTRRERAMEVIKLVGLEGREDYYPRELSGGQQQRVGIARSLAIEPDIWFLDEPFSALDPLIRREMQDEFLRLQAMLGKTIVFITHDFDEALRLADRIAIMKDGVIEQVDTPDKIVLSPQTSYVKRFIEDIDKSRVVHAGALASPFNGTSPIGTPVDSKATIHALARQLVDENREKLPVANDKGEIVGLLDRREALDLLLGSTG